MELSENIGAGYARIFESAAQKVRDSMERAPQEMERAARTVLSGGRGGRIYSFGGANYRASAPGEAPAKRSGEYLDSWRGDGLREEKFDGGIRVTAAIICRMPELARILEQGQGMAERPHFERIIESAAKAIRSGI